jgi:methylmalonyl-CoA/ethylmalonyl-CoA epimerase
MDKTEASGRTGLDMSKETIVQFSLVVKDVEKVAKRFSEIFGVSWKFYDLKPKRVVLHDKVMGDVDCHLKIAIGSFGGRSLKLIQPISGQSSYQEFLQKNGEGFYTIGLGVLANHDEVVNALREAGVSIEMQGDLGNGATFSVLGTVEELGGRFEISSPANQANESCLVQTGELKPAVAPFVDMDKPVFSGGKKVNQVGIVVQDEKKAAKRFEELLGIRNWIYAYGPPGLSNARLNENPVPESEMEGLDVAFANSWLGDIQIELIRPIGLRPGGCHQWFFDKKGNGIQHLSFGLQADYAAIVEGMKKAGIGDEFFTWLNMESFGVLLVSYLATQQQLGGFQLEILGTLPYFRSQIQADGLLQGRK